MRSTSTAAIVALTRDAPKENTWVNWREWFRALLPAEAVWHRCCIGIPEEPEPHVNVSWNGWLVRQVGSWYEITSGRTTVVTPQWEMAPLRRVVAILRTLGALPLEQP